MHGGMTIRHSKHLDSSSVRLVLADPETLAALHRIRVTGGHHSDVAAVRAALRAADPLDEPIHGKPPLARAIDVWLEICGSEGITAAAAVGLGGRQLWEALAPATDGGVQPVRGIDARLIGGALAVLRDRLDGQGRAFHAAGRARTGVTIWAIWAPSSHGGAERVARRVAT